MGDDERRFQFTAPVQPGNSGGPVLDMSGNVIGVVVSKLNAMSIQDQVGDIPQNVNFGIALPSLVDFLNDNDVRYSTSGLSRRSSTRSISPNSPAPPPSCCSAISKRRVAQGQTCRD